MTEIQNGRGRLQSASSFTKGLCQSLPLPPTHIEQKSLTGQTVDDWNFNGSDTQYATHGMHTWLAAMVPPEARKLIKVTKAKRVLDPFCGGGTVLVECAINGLPADGIEINPLAVIISRAKTNRIEKEALFNTLGEVFTRIKNNNTQSIQFPKNYMVDYWFKQYMFKPLSRIVMAIKKIEDDDVRTFFQCVFSATARDVSLTYRNEIRLRRMNAKEMEAFHPDVIAQFGHRAHDSINRLQKIPPANIRIQQGTVLNLLFRDDEFTTIITSPPYGDERNGVPYSQFSKNMLYWLGWTKEDLQKSKGGTLGWLNHNEREFEIPPSTTLRCLLEKIKGERTKKEAIAFYADYYKGLQEMTRVTTDKIAIIIGQRVLEDRVFDNGRITTDLMESIDIKLEKHFERKLPSKRLPKMRTYGAAIDREDILIYDLTHKPD